MRIEVDMRVNGYVADGRWTKRFKVRINDSRDSGSGCRSEIVQWIWDNVDDEWAYPFGGEFWFKNSGDALAFKLRWS